MPDYSSRYGNAFSGGISGAATGASLGSMIAPGLGTVIGGVAGGLYGLGSGLFGKSDEEIARERYEAYKRSVLEQKAKALTEGSRKIGQLTSGLSARFRSGVGRRAAAMGRTNEVESFELPVVSQVASEGNKALTNFITDTNQMYDNALLGAERDYQFNRPIQPGVVDYLSEIAPSAVGLAQNQQLLDIIGGNTTGEVNEEVISNFMKPQEVPKVNYGIDDPIMTAPRRVAPIGRRVPYDYSRISKYFG